MLDNPEKTARLLTALKAAVPFEVEVLPSVIKHLQSENRIITNPTRQLVSDLSYAGDEGGIVCHIVPEGTREALIMSLSTSACRAPTGSQQRLPIIRNTG